MNLRTKRVVSVLALFILLASPSLLLFGQQGAGEQPPPATPGEAKPLQKEDQAPEDKSIVLRAERERQIKALIETAKTGAVAARCTAIRKLARLRHQEALPLISEALRDADEQVRAVAVDALGIFAEPSTLESLGSAANDPSARVAGSALRALARFEAPSAIPYLLAALEAEYEGVRYYASQSLTDLTGLDFGFRAESELRERVAALERWEKWWEQNSKSTPKEWWVGGLTEASPANRAACARRLGETGDMQFAVPHLIRALSDEVSVVRYHTCRALEKLTLLTMDFNATAPADEREAAVKKWQAWWDANKQNSRAAWLTQALKESSALTRARAATELGATGDKQHVPALAGMLLDAESPVRNAAAAALAAVTGLPAGARADDSAELREAAVDRWTEWCRMNEGREKRDWLAYALLNDADPVVRSSAARSLSAFPDHATVPLLFYGLQDRSDVVRAAAYASLTRVTGMSFEYSPDAAPEIRAAGLSRLKDWWYKEGANYIFPAAPQK